MIAQLNLVFYHYWKHSSLAQKFLRGDKTKNLTLNKKNQYVTFYEKLHKKLTCLIEKYFLKKTGKLLFVEALYDIKQL